MKLVLTDKSFFYIAALLIVLAFALRLFGVFAVPMVNDELELSEYLNQLPAEDGSRPAIEKDIITYHFVLICLEMKLLHRFFGNNILAFRCLSVLLGSLGLLLIFMTTRQLLGRGVALLDLALLALSQYHIARSRIFDNQSLLLFFCSLAIYLFFKAIRGSRIWFFPLCVVMVLGYMAHPLTTLLIPVFLIFIVWKKRHGDLLRGWPVWTAFVLMIVLIAGFTLLYSEEIGTKFEDEEVMSIGLSLRALYFFFADIMKYLAERFDLFLYNIDSGDVYMRLANGSLILLDQIATDVNAEDWLIGLVMFCGFFYCLRSRHRRNEGIVFFLLMFGVIFIVTTLANGRDALFDEHWWSSQLIFPGAVLGSYMLMHLSARFKFRTIAIAGLIACSLWNAIAFVLLPDSIYGLPKNDLYKAYQKRAQEYRHKGDAKNADRINRWLTLRAGN